MTMTDPTGTPEERRITNMADKIKAARARSRAAGSTKKQDRSSWFENHVVVMSCDDDEEKEQKLKEALKARVIMGQSGG